MNDLPMLAVKRPLLIFVLNLLIVIAGVAAFLGTEVRELPNVDRPVVTVTANLPGAAPETMDAEVTSVLENAAARVNGVRQIRSSSEENNTRIRVQFEPGTDLDAAASDIRESVSRVTRELPDRVEQVRVVKADEDAESIMTIAVSSDAYDVMELTRIVENDITPELLAADGVASIDPFGTRERQLRVAVDPNRLARFGLTISDVAGALEQAPFDTPVGSLDSDAQTLIVRAEATAATPELIANVVIREEVRIGDVAEAYFAPADATSYVRLDGEPVIGLGIIRQANSNTIAISDASRAAVDRLNERFEEIDIRVISDDAAFIRVSVQEVLTTLIITVAVVMATIFLFFGHAKPTLIPSASIPIALIGVVAGIWVFGFSINLLTLLALVLATGLVVDDAIVVLENAQRLQKNEGLGKKAAAVLGTRQVYFAVIATTAVLVSVFVPISFLPSETGRLFREFGFVLAMAVILSTFVAVSLVPALAAKIDLADDNAEPNPRLADLAGRFARRYRSAVERCIARPAVTVGVSLLALVAAGVAYTQIPEELTPDEDRSTFYIWASGPDGVGLNFMDREMDEIEEVLDPVLDNGEVESTLSIVGRYDPNRIFVTATLADWDERERSQAEIVDEVSGPLENIPGSRMRAFGRGTLSGGWGGRGGGIEVALLGNNYEGIYDSARRLSDAIATQSDILSDPEISYQPTQPQLSIGIDRQRAADLGVDFEDLALTLRAMVSGNEVVDLNVDDQAIPIFLTADAVAINRPSDLGNLYVRSDTGALVPISSLTQFTEEGVAAELDRTEQRRAIEVEAAIAPGTPLADAVAEIERMADEALAEDIDMILQGEAEQLEESGNELLLTYGFALLIVFLVLVAQFESIASPFVILCSIPFALAAALFALLLSGTSLNIYSQIGLVMLIGLMAKNGILMVEFADQRREEGANVPQAIADAAAIRLRPIAMTLISTILGAIPLVLASGAGAEARESIGWVIFGGLGIAAVFTLFLVPALYTLIAPLGKPRSVDLARLKRELDEHRNGDGDGDGDLAGVPA
ncbi:efflux RND transporter permease subunit [Qipengyuania sp. S6317L1]|uniref:efflux RND transporter permease subunit n=1 Tax=Qipengyuania sp. S6317L1 TaxID=2926410 RepID=UPI001FF2DD67|nr:efflux RND transporter permease subunit [Qipengyuania sp. S6317L1]MCK0098585.1 efflux RND transporter permease subunit [Qipengyuania sp. S6317L1]